MATSKKTSAKKKPAQKTKAKAKSAAKSGSKAAAKKTAAKKAPAKKKAVKKAAAKTTKKPAAKKTAAKKTAAKGKAVAPKAKAPKKLPRQKGGFKVSDFIVYPTHGVGKIIDIEEREIAEIELQLFVVEFEQDKMILRVPLDKAKSTGMRPLSSKSVVGDALTVLKGKARIRRTMWSRRAQEYEAKINSGDLIAISEVVRDLYRAEGQPEQSYSERQLYEQALDRMIREVAAVEKESFEDATALVEKYLFKPPVTTADEAA